ncbi:glycosyltransferase family 2 protein [Massilia horti]|uniref:Glycosyltransferase family 2 protein n=1 Tax=Massilia horti TaxID=2562153 RepID=A0A4Y9T295_9BURK|nr:glycosyltransferase family A protein [Massilia horti]TFW33616.1 glycosyltransferase family 2 protein [Massilia horti]
MQATSPATAAAAIGVSVVVPTCGRQDLLDRCLDALTRQTLAPSRFEVIVVDDGPSHDTLRLVANWRLRTALRGGPRLFYIANAGPHGPAAARNRGWRAAQAPLVAFTDDDTVPSPDWLAAGLGAFLDGVDALCGRIEMPLPDQPTDYERNARELEDAQFVTANCFCRKSVLEALDGFDERFTAPWREDSDLHFRLLEMHARVVHAPQALVVHPVRPAPWGVSLLQIRKIAFDALLYKKHPRLYRERIARRARWDYHLIVGALLAACGALLAGSTRVAAVAALLWLALTGRFCVRRLAGTVKTPAHVTEMVITSVLIPPLAVFWRLAGAIRYRVRFA